MVKKARATPPSKASRTVPLKVSLDIGIVAYKIKKRIYSLKSPAERLLYIRKLLGTKLNKDVKKSLEAILRNIKDSPNLEQRFEPQRLEETVGEEPEEIKEKTTEEIRTALRPATRTDAKPVDYSKPAELEQQLAPGQSIEQLIPETAKKEMFAQQATYAAHESTGSRLQATLAHYVAREGIAPGQPFELHPSERQLLVQRVSEYLGGTYAEYKIAETLQQFEHSGLPAAGEKPEEKYKRIRIRDESI